MYTYLLTYTRTLRYPFKIDAIRGKNVKHVLYNCAVLHTLMTMLAKYTLLFIIKQQDGEFKQVNTVSANIKTQEGQVSL